MREPMSNEFVFSFLKTCMEAGLSKSAAAELLQHQSVIHTAAQSPAWAEGYAKVASEVPGAMLPMFRDGYMDKEAAPASGVRLAWQGAKSVARGLAQAGRSGAGKVVAAPGKLNSALSKSKVLSKYPLATGALGTAAAGGAIYGANKLMGGGRGGYSGVPTLPGAYDAEASAAKYDSELESVSKGVYKHNKDFFNDYPRRKALEDAVKANGPGSGAAAAELLQIKKERERIEKTRKGYMEDLSATGEKSRGKLAEIEAQQQSMEESKHSLWKMPYRGFLRMTGRDPDEYYDKRIAALQGGAERYNTDAKISAEAIRRMNAGVTNGGSKSRTPAQIQNDFFPSYN